jgi:hypothetical protein
MIEAVQNSRLQRYIRRRDTFRTERGSLPKWFQFNIKLAAAIWQMKALTHSRTIRNRLLFDKHWHGGNQAKDKHSTINMEKCPFCVSPDSAGHWMVYCQESPRATDIRKEMFQVIRSSVRTYAEDKGQYKPAVESLEDHYVDFLKGRDAPDIWRGLWTEGKLESFGSEASDQYFPDEKVRILRKAFFLIGKIVTDAVIRIWQARQLTEFDLVEYMKEHPNINYTPPEHVTYPNVELPAISQDRFAALVQSATSIPPEPIVKISLTKTNRRLKGIPPVASVTPIIEEPVNSNMIVLHPPPETVRIYPKHKPMSIFHRLQNKEGKKKAQHYKEKRRAPIPVEGTPSIWNYCSGNPNCVVPPRVIPPPPELVPRPRKPKRKPTMTYMQSESRLFSTLQPEYSDTGNSSIEQTETVPALRSSAQLLRQGLVRTVEDPVLTFDPG